MAKMLILILLLLTCGFVCCEEVTIDLSTVELPSQAQKALDKYAEEKVKAEQEFRKAMEKLRESAIRDLQRQHKRADGLVQLAIQERIKLISQDVAVDLFGDAIEEPTLPMPAVLQKMLDGQAFMRRGASDRIVIKGTLATYGNYLKGDVRVLKDSFEINWANKNTVTVSLREDGVPILTRSEAFGGRTFELLLVE